MILALRAAASSLVWVSRTSSICSPQRTTGLSAVIGSWKIIAMRDPRSWRRRPSLASEECSRPAGKSRRRIGFSALASRPMTVKAITRLARAGFTDEAYDLAGIDREAHLFDGVGAVATPRQGNAEIAHLRRERAFADTASTISSDPLAHLWIERVAQSVAHDVDRQHREGEEDARDRGCCAGKRGTACGLRP